MRIQSRVSRHKKYPPAGKKIVIRKSKIIIDRADFESISEGEEVTLMDWGNCIVEKKLADGLKARLHLEGDFKKTKLKLTWLPVDEELVPLELVYFDYLITKKKLEEGDNFEEFVNENTKTTVVSLGDPNMRSLSKGDIIQIERKGYFIVDRPFWKSNSPMILFDIPDGKAKKS